MKYFWMVIFILGSPALSASNGKLGITSCANCYNFVAPSVTSAESIDPAEAGLIVYDVGAGIFRGLTASGLWTKLSSELSIKSSSTNFTASLMDDFISIDASLSAVTVSLPAASLMAGKSYTVKKVDSSFNTVTVDASSDETIDGALTKKLSTKDESILIVSDGESWKILKRTIPSVWTAYVLTGTWTAAVTYTGLWRRVGENIELQLKVATGGSTTAASLKFDLPNGLTIATPKLLNANSIQIVGQGVANDSAPISTFYPVYSFVNVTSSTTVVCAGLPGLSAHTGTVFNFGTDVTNAVPFAFGSGDSIAIEARIPISGWEN